MESSKKSQNGKGQDRQLFINQEAHIKMKNEMKNKKKIHKKIFSINNNIFNNIINILSN